MCIHNRAILKTVFVFLLAIIGILFVNSIFKDKSNLPSDLFIYSIDDINRFLLISGNSELNLNVACITRNSGGSQLRFINGHFNRYGLSVSDKTIEKFGVPGMWASFDDDNQPIMWMTKDNVYFKNGIVEERTYDFGKFPDPAGKYFFKNLYNSNDILSKSLNTTQIYSINNPKVVLKTISMNATNIFTKNSKIFIFGYKNLDKNHRDTVSLIILNVNGDTIIKNKEIEIKSPTEYLTGFRVVDLCPWRDEILFVDRHDFPYRSKLYIFDLKLEKMTFISKLPYNEGVGFYLKSDILKNHM